VPTAVPSVIVATTFTVPAPVAVTTPAEETAAPAAVLPDPRLQTMVWFVAFKGTTAPDKLTGVPTKPVVGVTVIPVTGTNGKLRVTVALWVKFVPIAVPFVIVATTFTVPAPVAVTTPAEVTAAPAAVLPEPKLQTIVWFVAFSGATAPDKLTGVPTKPVVGVTIIPVTGTNGKLRVTVAL